LQLGVDCDDAEHVTDVMREHLGVVHGIRLPPEGHLAVPHLDLDGLGPGDPGERILPDLPLDLGVGRGEDANGVGRVMIPTARRAGRPGAG
jgi:hypothetical protein